MQLHIKAAALMAATLVGGCGFVPKKPPKPVEGQRIPINLTAPNPRPWAGPPPSQPSQPELIALPSMPTPSDASGTKSDVAIPLTNIEAPSQTQPPLIEERTQVAQLSPPEEPLAIWPVLLTFNPNEQLDSSATRLPSERVSFTWPEQPVKATLPDPKLAVESLPEPNPPKEANTQPISLAEVKSESPLHIASSLPSDAKATDQGSNVRTSVNEQQDTNATPRLNSEPVPGQVEQGGQSDALALNKPEDIESPAPQTEARPELESLPEPAPPLLKWSAQAGMTLSEMLSNWGADQGWIVRWASEADYRIEAPFSIQAPDFLAAASHVFNAYRDAGRSFNVTAYANQVLVVKVPTD